MCQLRSYLLRAPEQLQRFCLSGEMQMLGWIMREQYRGIYSRVAKYLRKPPPRERLPEAWEPSARK